MPHHTQQQPATAGRDALMHDSNPGGHESSYPIAPNILGAHVMQHVHGWRWAPHLATFRVYKGGKTGDGASVARAEYYHQRAWVHTGEAMNFIMKNMLIAKS